MSSLGLTAPTVIAAGSASTLIARPIVAVKSSWNRWFADSPLEGDGFEPSVPLVKAGRLIPSAGAARHHPDLPRHDPGPEVDRETNRWHPQRKREIMGLMAVADPAIAIGGPRADTNRVSELADQYLVQRVRLAIGSNRLEDGSSLNFLWISGGIAGPGSILRPRTAAISE